MNALLDPATVVALALGLMTALLFGVVAVAANGVSGRRYRRRLAVVSSGRKRSANQATGSPETRSLSRRETSTPLMDRFVKSWLPRRELLVARVERTGRPITVGHYALATVGTIVVTSLCMIFFVHLNFMPSLLVGLAVGVILPHMVIGHMGKRRINAFLNLFPDAIDLIVRALRSGLPISEAIVNAAHEVADPVGVEFTAVESGMRMGRDLDSLLWEIAKRIDAPELRFFIISLGVQRETGGNLAETLQNLGDLLRRRKSLRQKARAMASEARESTAILGSLPIVVTIILLMTSPTYISILFTDVRGLMLLGIAIGMLVAGIGIMIRMAKFQI